MNATDIPSPGELSRAVHDIALATGASMFGARLALERGDLRLAHRLYLIHARQHRGRLLAHLDPGNTPDPFDGLDPAELFAREAALDLNTHNRRTR